MDFSIGYNLRYSREVRPFAELAAKYPNIVEVYFPAPGVASGRPQEISPGGIAGTWRTLLRDLAGIRASGRRLNMLLNGGCYGASAVSPEFGERLLGLLGQLSSADLLPDSVTTTSPFVAKTVRKEFAGVKIRASVTMNVREVQSMRYLSGMFDGFYASLSVQRDTAKVKEMSEWCRANGKGLSVLANTSCLGNCPFQQFHSNLVAHGVPPGEDPSDAVPCRGIYAGGNAVELLRANWIRPEDVRRYEGLVDTVKLSTRFHSDPEKVAGAYCSGRWDGNLVEILDPEYEELSKGFLDSGSIPADFFDRTSSCGRRCDECGYCEEVAAKAWRMK